MNRSGEEIEVHIKGRHDPIIVPRAVVVLECMTALTVLDAMLLNMSARMDYIADFYAVGRRNAGAQSGAPRSAVSRSGGKMEGVGFTQARTTTVSPSLMPPRMPPA